MFRTPTTHPAQEAATRSITTHEEHFFSELIPHYQERCEAFPNSRKLKDHYDYLQQVLKSHSITTIDREIE